MERSYTTDRIGSLLRSAREAKGIRQNALARELSIAAQTLSAYENGSKLPTLDNLMALAEALDLSVDALLGCRGSAGGQETTLGDLARGAVALLEKEDACVIQVNTDREEGTLTFPALVIQGQPKLARFLSGYKKMAALRADGTVDEELFRQWITASLTELDGLAL